MLQTPTAHFLRHYLEMVVAMLLGMAVLYTPIELAFDPSETIALLGMGATMTLPMVAWMRYRGHAWRLSAEMAAAMLAPTAVALALVGTVEFHTLMTFEHIAMFAGMFAAMLARRDEYSHAHASVRNGPLSHSSNIGTAAERS